MKATTISLLRESANGDQHAVSALFAMVYEDLHRRARGFFQGESAYHTLQPTALVHEAFLKMVDQRNSNWRDRTHFCRVAAIVMRRILVDHARRKKAEKRGSGERSCDLDLTKQSLSATNIHDVLLVDTVLERLAASEPQQAAIVEMRFFGGMSVEEVSEVLAVSKRTVEAEWTLIRALLRREMASVDGPPR